MDNRINWFSRKQVELILAFIEVNGFDDDTITFEEEVERIIGRLNMKDEFTEIQETLNNKK
jgi:hypothetical protein